MKERRYDIDWLRVIAIIAVFFLHTTHFFDEGTDWHLINNEQSIAMTVIRGLIDLWVIPLFFLLSGAGTWYALKSRTAINYLFERFKRLVIPVYTVGLFILIPPQLYFELHTHKGFTGKIWELIPPLYNGVFKFIPEPFLFTNFWIGHLWFLQFLFLVSFIILPVLFYLKSKKGQNYIERFSKFSEHWGGIFLLLIPLALIKISLTHFFEGQHTWADFFYFSVYFLIGYVMPADNRITESLKRHGWFCLGLGMVSFGIIAFFVLALDYNFYGEDFSLKYIIFQAILSLTNFSLVVFMLSLGAKYLNFCNKFLTYSNEAVLPFYILHQTIILIVGWYILPWQIGIFPKFLIISVISFGLIMLIYEAVIRHFNLMRFLFGLRLIKGKKI